MLVTVLPPVLAIWYQVNPRCNGSHPRCDFILELSYTQLGETYVPSEFGVVIPTLLRVHVCAQRFRQKSPKLKFLRRAQRFEPQDTL